MCHDLLLGWLLGGLLLNLLGVVLLLLLLLLHCVYLVYLLLEVKLLLLCRAVLLLHLLRLLLGKASNLTCYVLRTSKAFSFYNNVNDHVTQYDTCYHR